MRFKRFQKLIVGSAALVAMALVCPANAATRPADTDDLRDWTSETSIAVRYFSPSQANTTAWPGRLTQPTDFILRSPDGNYFFAVSHHGVLKSDSNVYELTVFNTDLVGRALKRVKRGARPRVKPTLTISFEDSTSNEDKGGILDATWLEDSSGILFRGVIRNGTWQLHCLHIPSGKLEQVTNGAQDVSSFTYRDGGAIYSVLLPGSEGPLPYPMDPIARGSYGQPMNAYSISYVSQPSSSVFVKHLTGPARRLDVSPYATTTRIAPGGKRAIGQIRGGHYAIVDLENGSATRTPFVIGRVLAYDAKHGTRVLAPSFAQWTENDRGVLITNVVINGESSSMSGADRDFGSIVLYDVESGDWKVVAPIAQEGSGDRIEGLRYVSGAQWLVIGSKLLVTVEGAGRPTTSLVYALQNGTWVRSPADTATVEAVRKSDMTASKSALEIYVAQSADQPPRIVASDGTSVLALTGEDPALVGVWRARAELVSWVEPDGRSSRGLLMLPRSTKKGTLVPLVVQAYHYSPDLFLPDGDSPNVYAAQALVAKGIAVLQINSTQHSIEEERDRPRNLERGNFVGRLDAAVSMLSEKGVIDPNRVGVSGYSRTGHLVLYALSNPGRVRLAAAAASDFYSGTYAEYLASAGRGEADDQISGNYELEPGGAFWDRKSEWLSSEPTFNLDRVRTPLLVFNHLEGHAASRRDAEFGKYDDLIGAFSLNKRPLELFSLPYGGHTLKRPRERLAEMKTFVDWMSFWLQDTIPADSARAARWAELREQQEAVMRLPQPPRGKWIFVPEPADAAAAVVPLPAR